MEIRKTILKVCTFNIRGWSEDEHDGINAWGKRAILTSAALTSVGADIVGIQEFSGSKNLEFYNKNLPGMMLHVGPKMDGDRYNPIVFKADRFSVVEAKDIWLSPSGEPVPAWGADETRSANLVVFQDKQTSHRVVFVNTHLDHRSEEARIEGTKRIVHELSRYPEDIPIVVVGDFNSSSHKPRPATMKAHDLFLAAGFTDAFRAMHPEELHENPPHTFHKYRGEAFHATDPLHIDWILVKGCRPLSYEIYKGSHPTPPYYPSDHYPIAADLQLL